METELDVEIVDKKYYCERLNEIDRRIFNG
jgi:hypothetical protein